MAAFDNTAEAALYKTLSEPISLAPRATSLLNEERQPLIIVVENGILKQYVLSNSRRQVMAVHYAGEGLAHWYPQMRLCAAVSASFRVANSGEVGALVDRYSAVGNVLRSAAEKQQAIATQWLVKMVFQNSEERFAHFLCEQAHRSGAIARGHLSFYLFKQRELAECLAVTAVHVNRLVHEFERHGLINLSRRQIEILDWTEVARIGSFKSDYLN